MKILVVDDDELMLKSIQHSLKEGGYEILIASDVYKAIDILEEQKIDLIVSDIMMPNISGLGLLGLLKQFNFDKIPVIIISSLNKGDVVFNSIGLGAAHFLPKPIDLNELRNCVKDILK